MNKNQKFEWISFLYKFRQGELIQKSENTFNLINEATDSCDASHTSPSLFGAYVNQFSM